MMHPKSKSVIQLISSDGVYGAERVVLDLAAYFARRGWDSRVVAIDCPGADALLGLARSRGIATHKVLAANRFLLHTLRDLRDYALPFCEEAFPPGYAKDNYDNPIVITWREKIREADGFILVTPEYNHGYPAVLKNALDYVYHVWGRKAVAFVSWGGAGGTRGVEQLRLVAIELDMVPIRWAVHIPNPWFIQDMSGIATDQNNAAAAALLDHLTWWTSALKAART